MAKIDGTFRGLATDVYPTRLNSGDADVATNVEVEAGSLKKRSGFGQLEDAMSTTVAILNVFTAKFVDGDVYVVCKGDDAKLYHRKVYPTDAGSFTAITTKRTHSTTDRGWFFMWGDRLHYFDSKGGSRWNPDINSGTAYKAGLGRPTIGAFPPPLSNPASSGEKDGFYHAYFTLWNSKTNEESVVSGTHTPYVECRLLDPNTDGGMIIVNYGTNDPSTYDNPDYLNFEWDRIKVYCTNGNTERKNKGANPECFSHVAYFEADAAVSGKGNVSVGLNKADHIHDRSDRFTNHGGEPPGAQVGMFTGSRAIYGRIFDRDTTTSYSDEIRYSIPGFPTSVPFRQNYTLGGDSTTIIPKPYEGRLTTGMCGEMTAMAFGGGIASVFSPTSTFALQTGPDGRLYLIETHSTKGAAGIAAACGTPNGVHALGYRSWLLVSREGIVDLAQDRFSSTLAGIAAGYEKNAVMSYYGHRKQVWAAVTPTGSTVNTRILVLDADYGLFSYDLAGFVAGESITGMCEMSYPGITPRMLVSTNKGRVLQYPTLAYDVTVAGAAANYIAEWQGYYGTERAAYTHFLDVLEIHCGDNVATNVTLSVSTLRTGEESRTDGSWALQKSNKIENAKTIVDRIRGRMLRIKFSSANTVSSQWTINDLIVKLKRTETT